MNCRAAGAVPCTVGERGMRRTFFKSKIHRATVTLADLSSHDVTEQKQAQDALRESWRKLF